MIDLHASSPQGRRLDMWIARIVIGVLSGLFVLVMAGVHAMVGGI
jgi:hypothetical protein